MKQQNARLAPVLLAVLATLFGGGCGTRPSVSAATGLAQASSQKGSQAFGRGDLAGARRDYQQALNIYDSLGDLPGRADALLSLARIASQAGQSTESMGFVQKVLADPAGLTAGTLVTAHGRAAALYLAQENLEQASQQIEQANTLCAGACADAGALAVLQARAALHQRQPARAVILANQALALPSLAMQDRPAPKPQLAAERANALRLRGQAQMSLGQAGDAAVSAAAALDLDQALGLAERVLPDLELLAQAHQAQGNDALAQHYRTLAARARLAGVALRGNAAVR